MGVMFILIFLMLCVGLAWWLFFVWAVKSGQYEDVEGPKHRMLDDEEPGTPRSRKPPSL
jgi:cbb3-type cytochrome oxidase maturation protein